MPPSRSLTDRPLLTFLKLACIEVAGFAFLFHGASRSGYFYGAILVFSLVSFPSHFNWTVPSVLMGSLLGSFAEPQITQHPPISQAELLSASNSAILFGVVFGLVFGVLIDLVAHAWHSPTPVDVHKQTTA